MNPDRTRGAEQPLIGRFFLNDELIKVKETSPDRFVEVPPASPQPFFYSPTTEDDTQIWEWVAGDGSVVGHTAQVSVPTKLELES